MLNDEEENDDGVGGDEVVASKESLTETLITLAEEKILPIILTYIGSQVDGVDENIVQLLRTLLQTLSDVSSLENKYKCFESFKDSLMELLQSYAWQVKSRYQLMLPLLNFFKISQIEVSRLVTDLRKCLSTNYLTPSSSAVYKAIITMMKSQQDGGIKMWKDSCCPHLVCALTSNKMRLSDSIIIIFFVFVIGTLRQAVSDVCSSDVRSHLRLYWPTTEEIILIKSSLVHQMSVDDPSFRKQMDKCLHSLLLRCRDHALSLLRTAYKRSNEKNESKNQEARVTLSLVHGNDFDGGCGGSVINCIEFLDFAWGVCLECLHPSSNFQRLYSSLSWMRLMLDVFVCRPHQGVRKPDVSLLISLAAERGSCDFFNDQSLFSLLRCVGHEIHQISQMACDVLEHYFQWPLYCPRTLTRLMKTMMTTTDCDNISNSILSDGLNFNLWLLRSSLLLCSSVRTRETHCGVTLCGVLYRRYILDQEISISIGRDEHTRLLVLPTQRHNNNNYYNNNNNNYHNNSNNNKSLRCGLSFLNNLLQVIEGDAVFVSENFSNYVQERMIYGLLSALSACLQSLPLITEHSTHQFTNDDNDNNNNNNNNNNNDNNDDDDGLEEMMAFNERVVDLVEKLTSFSLDVFGGCLTDDDTAPSFEQINQAIMSLIGESIKNNNNNNGGDDDDDGDGEKLVNIKYQAINSWCWLNIKECGLLLGALTKVAGKNNFKTIHSKDIRRISDCFFKCLTQCRHRGAIESCTIGFTQFTLAVFQSEDDFIRNIPHLLLDKVFRQLSQLSKASVTRRSAGLPSVILSILVSEAKLSRMFLLKKSVEKLLDLCRCDDDDDDSVTKDSNEEDDDGSNSNGDGEDEDDGGDVRHHQHHQQQQQQQPAQLCDKPKVHGLNILKTLVQESCLSDCMSQYVEDMMDEVLQCFHHDDWMVRNAALQLFGSLVPRLLGEKSTTNKQHLHITTSCEFFKRYPRLFNSLVDVLSLEINRLKFKYPSLVQFNHDVINDVSTSTNQESAAINRYKGQRSSLIPVLTLLSGLSPSTTADQSSSLQTNKLLTLVQCLSYSEIWKVRQLSSFLLPVLVPRCNEYLYKFILFLIGCLFDQLNGRYANYSTNHVHGLLMQIGAVAALANKSLKAPHFKDIKSSIGSLSWLLDTPCLIVRHCYVKLMQQFGIRGGDDDDEEEDVILKHVRGHFAGGHHHSGADAYRDVGSYLYETSLVEMYLGSSRDPGELTNHILTCLNSPSNQIVELTLKWLVHQKNGLMLLLKEKGNDLVMIFKLLWKLLKKFITSSSWLNICSSLQTLCNISRYTNYPAVNYDDDDGGDDNDQRLEKHWSMLMQLCDQFFISSESANENGDLNPSPANQKSYKPACLAFQLISILMKSQIIQSHEQQQQQQQLHPNTSRNIIRQQRSIIKCNLMSWSSILYCMSECYRNYDIRLSAVKSLNVIMMTSSSTSSIFEMMFKGMRMNDDDKGGDDSDSFVAGKDDDDDVHWRYLVFIRLFDSTVNFLNDEDSDVRKGATEAVSFISNGCSVQPSVALQLFLEHATKLMEQNGTIEKFIWHLFYRYLNCNLKTYIQNSQSNCSEMFKAGEDNPYLEAAHLHALVTSTITLQKSYRQQKSNNDKVTQQNVAEDFNVNANKLLLSGVD
ncbi:hypothetical protein HELRODRAFT_192654 [Helobdella robusta]|uniref:Uncharacterized protein n=1 Tax=Helobdella robusta TaxID=6412 RepID=T1FU59_HELRO|nr:hypothetical protein HELRODRAFT_192654 [Helobdella robusta]ESN99933.1 hypothetical protein HELRODRAFT_192654 [Helobdella robusta]